MSPHCLLGKEMKIRKVRYSGNVTELMKEVAGILNQCV
jgi:hypothetical protein